MRYWIALAAAVVLVGSFLTWKSLLVTEVQRDFAKFGLSNRPEGFGTELPKSFERKVALSDFLRAFQIPIVVLLVAIPTGAALAWPKSPTEDSASASPEKTSALP